MDHRWPTVQEASEQTGYNPSYLRRLIREGKLKTETIGQSYLIDPDSLRAYTVKAKQHPRGGARSDDREG